VDFALATGTPDAKRFAMKGMVVAAIDHRVRNARIKRARQDQILSRQPAAVPVSGRAAGPRRGIAVTQFQRGRVPEGSLQPKLRSVMSPSGNLPKWPAIDTERDLFDPKKTPERSQREYAAETISAA